MSELSKDTVEAIGWMYAYACIALDKGIDLRTVEVPSILEEAKRDLREAAK